ncbi:MAG: helix-turn-helix transcriptional regulator [Clostridium sp.]|nr:helix-turn-helix transcriptional regulator [Clostridium sp.]
MNIGERIREIRKSKNLLQSDLAEKTEISKVAIGNYE